MPNLVTFQCREFWQAVEHLCDHDCAYFEYFLQAGQYEKAASAAITFLVSNPHHEYMTRNVKNYKEKLGVSDKFFIDLQAGIYQVNTPCSLLAFL